MPKTNKWYETKWYEIEDGPDNNYMVLDSLRTRICFTHNRSQTVLRELIKLVDQANAFHDAAERMRKGS